MASFPAREKTKRSTEQTMISPCFYNFEHKLYIFSRVKLGSEKTGVATQKWCIEAGIFSARSRGPCEAPGRLCERMESARDLRNLKKLLGYTFVLKNRSPS